MYIMDDSRLAPTQWETPLQSDGVSHGMGTNLESALYILWLWATSEKQNMI